MAVPETEPLATEQVQALDAGAPPAPSTSGTDAGVENAETALPAVDAGAPSADAAAPLPDEEIVDEEVTSDAGPPPSPGPLPVTATNPIVIVNDLAVDNWFPEHALLAASTGRITLAGIVVDTSEYSPDLEANRAGWQELIDAARASGLSNVPDLVAGASPRLVVPAGEDVDATVPNASAGAQFIVETAHSRGTPELPLVVITGGTLTDIADAYLLDNTIADRIVAVGSLGQPSEGGSLVGGPNGEIDTWAGAIVAQRLRFVQVSAFYEHSQDVPQERLAELPQNPFGDWMAAKSAQITNSYAADQIALLSVTLPAFALSVDRVGYAGQNEWGETLLGFQSDGCCWFVSVVDATRAAELLWEMLQAPNTFAE